MQAPEIHEYGLGYRFCWPDEKIDICLDQIRESSRNGSHAEMNARYLHPDGAHSVAIESINLTSVRSRESLVKHLTELDQHPDKAAIRAKWKACVEYACVTTLQRRRRGEPALRLCPSPTLTALPWRVNPWVYESQPTVFFAPGGSGKSYVGLLAAAVTLRGGYLEHSNLCAVPGEVLILDWEADRQALELRWDKLIKAHSEFVGIAPPYYRRMERSLTDDLREVQRIVQDISAKLVIIDSLAPAAGGDPNAPETAIAFHKALRALKCSSLSLAHVAKADEGKARTIFGSAFFTNLARSVWELKPSLDEDSSVKHVTLYHTKVNDGPKQRPMAFRIDFRHASGGTHIEPIGVDELPSQEATQSNVDKIKAALVDGPKTNKELEGATRLPATIVSARCNEGKGKWCVKHEGKWTLLGVRN